MEKLFTALSHAVEGAPLIALAAATAWGILSIILSPCHLASIPLIVGFISEQGKVTVKRAFWTSTLFAVGILITIAAIGAITAAAAECWVTWGVTGIFLSRSSSSSSACICWA